MTTTATRLIQLIMLLQRKTNQKASDLAIELGISVRTLHRYFSMLDEIGIPIYSERGPYGGFSLVRGYKMPPLVLTPEESVAVYLGTNLVEEMWGQLYRQAARGALAKLENLLPDEQRHEVAWARRALAASGMHRADLDQLAPTLEILRQAVREHCRIHILYQGSSHVEKSERDIDPYALVHRWGWWYVAGYCHLRRKVRTFRVDRITELSLSDITFSSPEDFDLHAYLGNEPQAQPKVMVCMRFIPEATQVALGNRSYWESLESNPDGSVLVFFSAPNLEWAASNVLAYGPIVEAIDPPELRSMLAKWTNGLASIYSNGEMKNGEARFTETI